MMQKKFDVPIYNFSVYVTDFDHMKQLEELADAGRELGGVVYWCKGKLCIYIATDNPKRTGEFIAHESVHCAYEILKTVGVQVDASNHEALAYLVGFIYNKIYNILKREITVNAKKGSYL